MKKLIRKLILLFSLFTLMMGLSACSTNSHSSHPKKLTHINVVATTNFYGEIAQEILGDHGTVTSIIDSSNIDPHDFEPTTKTAKIVAKGNLIIYNGLGYDTWVERLQGKKYLSVAKLVHAKNGANEHLWYDPHNIDILVNALVKQYSELLPQYKTDFQKNATQYKQKLTTLTNKIAQIKKIKTNTHVAVSEPVMNYALHQMGFKIVDEHFAMAIEEGSDPSYTDIRNLQNDIKYHRIAFFVLNKQSDSKIVNNMVALCQKEKIPVIKVTETIPTNDSYIQWFNNELNQILKVVNDV